MLGSPSALGSPDVAATVADTLKSEVISKLRSQYLELARREADWTPRYGANHLAVVNVRNQMRELQNSIRNELERIAETYQSDFEIAKQHEESVQKQLDQAVSQSHVTNEAQVALRELESNAQTYRALYDNFLQRYMEFRPAAIVSDHRSSGDYRCDAAAVQEQAEGVSGPIIGHDSRPGVRLSRRRMARFCRSGFSHGPSSGKHFASGLYCIASGGGERRDNARKRKQGCGPQGG